MDTGEEIEIAATPAKKHAWLKTIPEQVQAIRAALAAAPPRTGDQLARAFTRAQTKKVEELLETIAALGQVRQDGGATRRCERVAVMPLRPDMHQPRT